MGKKSDGRVEPEGCPRINTVMKKCDHDHSGSAREEFGL